MEILVQPDTISVFEDVIVNKTPTPLVLDGRIFVHCKVQDSEVRYSGGFTSFDETNTVSNSSLKYFFLGSEASISGFTKHLIQDYQWTTINDIPGPFH